MLDILREVGLDPMQFLTLLAASSIVLILAFRPFVISLIDPLNVFVVSMCACAVLMFGMNWAEGAKIEFAFFVFFFWLGFASAGKVPARHPEKRFHADGLLDMQIVLLLVCIAIVVANVYLGVTAGFPLLSADPSISKVTAFTGGLGIIRHLNFGPFLFLCCGCTLFIAIGYKQTLALTLLAVSSAFIALSGAKSALLPILFVQAFVIHHNGLRMSATFTARLRRFVLPSFGAALAVAIAVIVRDNGGITRGIIFLAKRLLFYGDVILFYYPRRGVIPELAGANPFTYIKYLVDPLLGMFRLEDYTLPLGTIIAGNLDAGFGPNVQYFVRADIFFGPVFGCGYCLAIGYIGGMLRRSFFTLRTNNVMIFTFALMMAVSAFTLATESQLFVSEVADTALFLFPLWAFAYVARMAAQASHRLPEATS